MIKVTVTEDGETVGELEFDGVNIVHHEGALAVVSRDVMRSCPKPSLWHRVAHAAAWVAETGDLDDLF